MKRAMKWYGFIGRLSSRRALLWNEHAERAAIANLARAWWICHPVADLHV